ncbi:ureidoglycolate lyase [Shimia gijangensis]|uniref:Ureidoglycolate lyase n=1 Tax=Shimia gijangensis TaxID=1470563 RepID=A0A1M6EPT9_9RHOB|nr:ureidoglycolate lyase [Shimia gijangensis]SHI87436.1 ureidoglycolate lyase [Shimia gijangensis]
MSAPVYMFDAASKPSLPLYEVPLVVATDHALQGYGCLVDDPEGFQIDITRWPAQGWRQIDEGTGDEGGFVEGTFTCDWRGDVLFGENDAVKGKYVLGWAADPQTASTERQTTPRDQILLWHMNYHPDGGQLFFPLEKKPFVVPLALPGDDLSPDKVVAFWCDGTQGLHIHANIWHEGIFPVRDQQRFLDRQGAVHARVSADIGQEFGVYLSVPLREHP